jgi:hypothetical protein
LAYLGNRPAESYASFEKQVFTIVNSQTAYTLDHKVTNENDIRLVINNVVQEPGSGKAYTASGTTLTLSAALVNGTDTMYCVFLGRAIQTVNPPNASVGSAQVADSLISGKTALASEPDDTDEFLVSDAGTLKRIDYSLIKGGGITEADQWRLTADFSSAGDITSNLERVDSTGFGYIGSGMSQSSGIFTFPSTGIYWIIMNARIHLYADDNQSHIELQTTTDSGSNYYTRARASVGENESGETRTSVSQSYFFDVTNTSTHKVKFSGASFSTTTINGSTDMNHTTFTFIRLGDT